jgi:altronate hydrolase
VQSHKLAVVTGAGGFIGGHLVAEFRKQGCAGANIVLFTTGLGTPTGNPIAPVVKLSTNSALAQRMPDIIDVDIGAIISGEKSIAQMGEEVLEFVIKVASGEVHTKAEEKGQKDFIPWKRGISL